jgi:hypothetical protein
MRHLCIMIGTLLLAGCVYRGQIYAPEALSAKDHVQRSEVFIFRDSLSAQLHVSRHKNLLQLNMVFTAADPSTRFESMEFSLHTDDRIVRPISPPETYSLESRSSVPAPLIVTKGEWLVVEFDIGTNDPTTFRIRIPPVTIGGRRVDDLEELVVSKKRIWKAISPL